MEYTIMVEDFQFCGDCNHLFRRFYNVKQDETVQELIKRTGIDKGGTLSIQLNVKERDK